MQTQLENLNLPKGAWFEKWFDSAYYHKLYQSRNDQEASDFIDALINHLQPTYGSLMLDLGCGNGRHSKYLAQLGFNVTGLDLALSSIQHAKKWETPALQFRQHDMRKPFASNQFNFIFNFFTSFGYFENEYENSQVVENISEALKSNGLVLFDYLNVAYAEKNLVAVEEKEIDGTLYHINRWSTDRFFYKLIGVYDASIAQPLKYVEKVARFCITDFERLFTPQGLQTVQVFGDYDLSPYDVQRSKRMIMIAKK